MVEKSRKVKAILRILELFHIYGELNAGKLFKILKEENLIGKNSRRLLNYYLDELKKAGFIELRGKGRGAVWLLKRKLFESGIRVDEEAAAVLILLVLSMPRFLFKNLRREIERIFKRLGIDPEILNHLERDIDVRYLYGIRAEKFLIRLAKVIAAIEQRRYVNIVYNKKGREIRELLPIGICLRKGKIYISAIDPLGSRKHFALERIEAIYTGSKIYRGRHFPTPPALALFFSEKPFLFGVEMDKPLMLSPEDLETDFGIFHAEIEGGRLKRIYLVGFTGEYFASRFLTFLYGPVIAPNEEMLRLAKRKGMDRLVPTLDLSDLKVNLKRFEEFLKTTEEVLKKRLQNLERSRSPGRTV